MWQVKYKQFYHVFHEKIVKLKGKQAKVGFRAWTWANFEAFESKNSRKYVKMFKTRKKFVKYELVRQQELEFDVDFRVNSSESSNHEKFSISFQFDEFFSTFELSPVKTDQKLANSRQFDEFFRILYLFLVHFGGKPPVSSFYTLILTSCPSSI